MNKSDYNSSMPVPTKVHDGILKLQKQGKSINKSQIRECDLYADKVLGNTVFAPWLYLYTCLLGEFKEGWLPGGYFHSYVSPKINGEYGRISKLSGLPKRFFSDDKFPDLIYYINGLFISKDGSIVSESRLFDVLFNNSETVYFKLDQSSEGKGIHIIKRDSFQIEKIKLLGNGLFQEPIVQHKNLDKIVPNSVATLRLVTVTNNKGVSELKASYLRLGRLEEEYVASNSQIAVPVDTETGILKDNGYLKDFTIYDSHPDTGYTFSNFEIPSFKKAVAEVIKLHNAIPYVRLIGWDVAINDKSEVELIEWNAKSPSVTFIEATMGPCFKGLGWENLWKE